MILIEKPHVYVIALKETTVYISMNPAFRCSLGSPHDRFLGIRKSAVIGVRVSGECVNGRKRKDLTNT